MAFMPCLHCAKPALSQANMDAHRRGLCRACYEEHAVRALYPVQRICRGKPIVWTSLPDLFRILPLAPFPTLALPGSEAKILVMMDRASRSLAINHPLDAIIPD